MKAILKVLGFLCNPVAEYLTWCVTEAADVLHELQVETFGSMEKREKTEFILEQVTQSDRHNGSSRVLVI